MRLDDFALDGAMRKTYSVLISEGEDCGSDARVAKGARAERRSVRKRIFERSSKMRNVRLVYYYMLS